MRERVPAFRLPHSQTNTHFGIGTLASLLLHALVLALMIGWADRRLIPAPPPQATVELVMQNTPTVGGAPRQRASVPHPPAAPRTALPKPAAPHPKPPEPIPPLPDAVSATALPLPPPAAPPAPPAPPRTAAAKPAPARTATPPVDLRAVGQPGTGLVSGARPASLDARFHNAPPGYPVVAADLGQQGAVIVMIHVAPDGHASRVVVTHSSGHPILDRAAQRAIARWHFQPALKNGAPVASDLPFRVVFQLN